MGFKFTKFTNLDTDCPDVTKHEFYEKDCVTPSAAIKAEFSSHENYLIAELTEASKVQNYTLCLKVCTSLN